MLEQRPAAAAFDRISVLLGIEVKMHSQAMHFTVLKLQSTWPPSNTDMLSKHDSGGENMAPVGLVNAQGTC
jgi:hypothetical protein